MLTRLYYESRITGRFGPLVLLGLQKTCVPRNRDAGLSSFLFHNGEKIFQVIEGEAQAVERCMKRIEGNDLHSDISIRAVMRCPDRAFQRWYFGATHEDDPDYRRVSNAAYLGDFFALDVLQAERLLGIVASRKRRAVKRDDFNFKVRNFEGSAAPRRLFAVPGGVEKSAAAG